MIIIEYEKLKAEKYTKMDLLKDSFDEKFHLVGKCWIIAEAQNLYDNFKESGDAGPILKKLDYHLRANATADGSYLAIREEVLFKTNNNIIVTFSKFRGISFWK